ncbi:hypothetical protein F2Q68_00010952 [Brassica cretica]|uniref:Uncharacterized protein n=1 Tax=Brassica cretica TaxID=69181 RepID=A0A8S9KR00_BRACR|nr:hypothetical protein F2Q68_00010952 [Brassica cretica]
MFKHKIGAALLRGRARGAGLTLGGLVALVVETGWVAGFGLVATLLVVVEWFMLVVVLVLGFALKVSLKIVIPLVPSAIGADKISFFLTFQTVDFLRLRAQAWSWCEINS